MSRAVTEDAPAVSEREPSSQFLPTDKNYRLTGEMPDEMENAGSQHRNENDRSTRDEQHIETDDQSENREASAASEEQDSSTAAASEAAEQQEKKGPTRSKTEKTSESRWAKLSRENRELQEQLRVERERKTSDATNQRDTKREPLPVKEDAEPEIANFATLGEYLTAVRKYDAAQNLKKWQEESAKTQRERDERQQSELIQKTVGERVEAARKTYADYDEVFADVSTAKDEFGHDALFFPPNGHIDRFLFESERGSEVLYQIAKSFDDPAVRAIFARDVSGLHYRMDAVKQIRELAKIEHALPEKSKATPSNSSARQVTQAYRPPNQLSGKGSVGKNAVETAVEENDFETYMREENAKALNRSKKKG